MIFYGDCLDLLKNIPDKSIDLVLVDPPYGTTACKWDIIIPFEPMWKEIERVKKGKAAALIFGTEPFSSLLRTSNIGNFKYDWVWEKSHPKGHLNANKQPLRAHEIVSVFYDNNYYPQKTSGHPLKTANNNDRSRKQTALYGKQKGITSYSSTERFPRSVIKFKADTQKENYHPTQKPVALLEYFIKTYSSENDTVLDFAMGSGSAGIACQNLKRNFIGIEKNKEFFDIAEKRLSQTAL